MDRKTATQKTDMAQSTRLLLLARMQPQVQVIINNNNKNDQMNRERPHGRNCAETTVYKESGIYEIIIPGYSTHPFKVACDAEIRGGSWTILMRRIDGSESFYRNWTEYKNGFGNGEFFLGLDKIHALTAVESQELLFLLEDFEGIGAKSNHKF